jgi:hypothetical protein
MVKRNQGWERRIEITEIRRSETKLRKQRTADKRQQKVYVQELLSLIDRHAQRPFSIHVWTDCIAADSVPLLDAIRADQLDKRKTRSVSMNEYDESVRGSNLLTGLRSTPKPSRTSKGRTRSNSVNDSNKPGGEDDGVPPLLLCRSHFFTGKCQDKGKKGGCRYNHYVSPYKTLSDVLRTKASEVSNIDTVLNQSVDNVASATALGGAAVTDTQAMEMIHYMQIQIVTNESEDLFVSEALVEQLAAHDVKPASIVYAVVNDKLIFDRYQEGLLLNDREFIALTNGLEGGGCRRLSTDEPELLRETLINLPGSILEHTLSFLPDSAVAVTTQVCKAWNQEIGHSPNLWRHMLGRRNWPLPGAPSPTTLALADEPTREAFRAAFIDHYTTIRDMKAIQSAMHALESRKGQVEKEMCYQDFSTRKFAPAASNNCVGVQVWSPNQILVGYSVDCSIRLFECVARDNDEKLCRELICHSIDPYKNTRRRNCVFVSMDIDQDFIGCLCQVNADNVNTEAWVLIVLSRDDFLLGDSSAAIERNNSSYDDQPLKVIDVGEAVLNYLLSSDIVDHRLLQLIDFLVAGGQVGDVEVIVSHSLAACGDGRFMVEVSISIPAPTDEDLDFDMLLIDRKLVLFSASAGAIVWIGESNDITKSMRPRHENMSLNHTRRRVPGGSRQFCNIVVGSPVSAGLMLGLIEPTGHVQSTHPIEASDIVREEILFDDWQLVLRSVRPVIVTAQDIVAADVVTRIGEDRQREHKSVISVFRLEGEMNGNGNMYRTISLDGNLDIVRLVNWKDHHVIALCREYHPCLQDEPDEAADDDEELPSQISLCAVCIQVSTGHEIGRFRLLEEISHDLSEIPIISNVHGSTIGIGFACKGVIMTGNDIRSVGDHRVVVLGDSLPARSSPKKKNKKVSTKSHRKDGFMRGMSLRG